MQAIEAGGSDQMSDRACGLFPHCRAGSGSTRLFVIVTLTIRILTTVLSRERIAQTYRTETNFGAGEGLSFAGCISLRALLVVSGYDARRDNEGGTIRC